jgi:outer membrane lipoprotein-sorting protein
MTNRDPLERATDALKNSAARTDFAPALRAKLEERTLEALRELSSGPPDVLPCSSQPRSPLFFRRKLMFPLMNAAAAAAVVAMTLSLVYTRSTHASFEEIQAAAAKANNLKFTMNQKLGPKSPEISLTIVAEGRKFRTDIGKFVSIIADLDARKGIQLERVSKIWRREVVSEPAATRGPSFVEDLKKLPPKEAAREGMETVDGKKLDVFQLKKFKFLGVDNTRSKEDDGSLRVWVDPATKLPVKLEMKVYQEPAKAWATFVMTDFSWNLDLPADTFMTTPPEGYTEKPAFGPDGRPVGEAQPAKN